jgi:hypothetical protein
LIVKSGRGTLYPAYAAFVIDLDGNNVEAVIWKAPRTTFDAHRHR